MQFNFRARWLYCNRVSGISLICTQWHILTFIPKVDVNPAFEPFRPTCIKRRIRTQQHWCNSPVVLGVCLYPSVRRVETQPSDCWTATNDLWWGDGNWRSLSQSNAQFPPQRMIAGHQRVALNFNRHSEWRARCVPGDPCAAQPLMSPLLAGT